jgi:hypothetical protein
MLNEKEQQLTDLFVLNHINISSFQKDIYFQMWKYVESEPN